MEARDKSWMIHYSCPFALKTARSTLGGAYQLPAPYRAPSFCAASLLPYAHGLIADHLLEQINLRTSANGALLADHAVDDYNRYGQRPKDGTSTSSRQEVDDNAGIQNDVNESRNVFH